VKSNKKNKFSHSVTFRRIPLLRVQLNPSPFAEQISWPLRDKGKKRCKPLYYEKEQNKTTLKSSPFGKPFALAVEAGPDTCFIVEFISLSVTHCIKYKTKQKFWKKRGQQQIKQREKCHTKKIPKK
jgi:hypothetical protein